MRPIKATFCVWLLSLNLAFAALPGGLVVTVRTDGNASNGGGFNPGGIATGAVPCTGGTDRSTAAAAFVVFDGATITATTAGVGAVLTITGYTPVTADKCNVLQITGGVNFTTGFYVITASAGGTWTLDRNATTGAGSAMTGNMGGALLTIQQAFTVVDQGSATNSDQICVKSGTYALTSATTLPTQANGVLVRGYQTTCGDNTGTKPLVTTATDNTKLFTGAAGASTQRGITFNNINFSNTASTRAAAFYAYTGGPSGPLAIINSTLDGFSIGIQGNFDGSGTYYFNWLALYQVEIKNCTSNGVFNAGSATIVGSRIHDNGGDGYRIGNATSAQGQLVSVDSSVFDHNAGVGFAYYYANPQAAATIKNSVFYANTLSGLSLANASQYFNTFLFNNIFDSNAQYGITADVVWGVFSRYNNAFRNNTLGALNTASTAIPADASDITLTAIPFTNAGAADFSLNSTAGGGAALRGLGVPGTIPNGGTGYIDVGALQSNGASTGTCTSSCVQ